MFDHKSSELTESRPMKGSTTVNALRNGLRATGRALTRGRTVLATLGFTILVVFGLAPAALAAPTPSAPAPTQTPFFEDRPTLEALSMIPEGVWITLGVVAIVAFLAWRHQRRNPYQG